MTKYLIDSNVFLRVFDDVYGLQYSQSLELIDLVKTNKINAVTCGLVLSEIDWVLRSFYNLDKKTRLKSLTYIKNLSNLGNSDNYNFSQALNFYSMSKAKFIDCMLASIPKVASKEWVIVSYDKDFKKLPIICKEPGEVVKTFK